ncbi:Hypothetical predicted protein [Mytilus galloprovincialis]|uniref:SAP domain-containing protein n=1 Tax=Mytilus galloprovincialis TaxID=29158 RepID=A0A8B6CJ02_MYTGA|nr:Hypothetical predicted protein [Mytilus galloprovincialis]
MSKAAFDAIAHHSGDWVKEEIQEDVDNIAAFTKGRLSTTALRKEITQNITKLVHDLLEPFQPLVGFIDPFLKLYNTVFGTIKNVKKAYDILKEGYQFARSIIDRLFGPRAHKEFPRDTRLSGNGCSGEGFYPSKKNRGSEYWSKGVDLEIEYHEDIVAPFPGYITRTNRDDEVVIKATGGSLQDVNIYITNIHPEGVDHPSDENDKGKLVSAGVKIGTATHSGCMNHIHVAFEKGEEGFIDPTRFFEGRPFSVPVWDQKCDDYKLVWKFETIAEGCILCLGEEDPAEDTSPEITSTVDQPSDLNSSDNPGSDVSSIKSDPGGMYNKFESSGVRKKRSLFGGSDKKNPFMTLLHKANTFFKKFSIKRLKMGTIINFLHKLKMTDSMNKMADVMKTIKKIIDNKPCFNPAQATDDQLVQELMERGKPFTGTRDQMIKRLTQADNQCPLLSFTMPENLVCTFDPMCMGVECCINVKLFMFLHTVKAYARFDPCQMEFHYGIDDWHNSIKLDIHIDGLKKDIRSGIKMNILGGIEIILRLEIQKTDSEAFANVGLGFCDQSDTSNCVVYVDLLKDAILPLPICHPDGSFEWPKIDWSKFFSKEAVLERLKNAGKSAAKQITQAAAGEILNALGLPKNLLLSTGPCPRPGKMTKGQLTEELKQRGLVVTGTDDERIQRLEDDDRRCKLFGKDHNLLPEITNEFLKDHLYYSVSSNCLRIDACTDFSIDLGANIPAYTKAFRAFIDVDFCKFIISFGFEGWKETLVLISYDWGTERNIPISKDIQIKLNIDKDDDRKMFIIDFGLKIVVGEKPLIDQYLLTKQEIPIPICNENFTLPGGGSFAGFLTALGGKLTGQAFDLVIKEMGLELPFGDFHVSYNIPFWFKMSPCDFDIDIKFGPFQHKTVLLNYDWGTPGVLTIGKGDKPPITINYSIDKMPNGQGFIVDVKITICFPLGDDPFCIPEHGLHMLQHQEIPACSKNFTDMMKNFSVSEIAKDFGLELKAGLKEGAVQFILERLGLEEFFSGPKCDKRRPPYSPAVQGWNNECPLSIFNLPNIEEMMSCHFTETCTGIECCVEIPYLGLTLHPFFLLDPCQYTLSFGINTINNTFSLFEYEWGKKEKISLADGVIQLEFTIKKPPEQKKFVIDLNVKTCLEEGKPCEVDEAIFQGTEVPQPMCDMEATMSLKNFSLTDWAGQVGAEIAGQLDGKFVKILLQQLGLDVMLKKPSCDPQSEMYSPAVKGWKSECPKPLSLPDLPSALTCYVPDYCTGIDCCYHFDYLDLSLNIYLYIDTCNYVIKGGIEKFTFELPFFHYNWGEEKEERLQEVIRIKYKINKLSEQKKFIVDLEFSICLEKDKCATKLPLFTKQLIPQPFCDMNMNFSITDVSLSEWMKDKGLQLGQSLSTALANRLLDELGLSPFMNEEQCDRYTGVFAGAVDGWNSQDCPLNMTLPKIHSSVSCYIPDYCTGISCCIEVGKIGKSFSTYALMDACNWKLSVGIEKRSFNISLSNYEWEFSLDKFLAENNIIGSVQGLLLDQLMEALGITPYFKDTPCNRQLPPFSSAQSDGWNNGIPVTDSYLPLALHNQMAEYMVGYKVTITLLKDTPCMPCNRQLPPFSSAQSDGWNNECKLNLPYRLPTLSGPLTCQLTDTCTGIQCCVEIKEIGKSIDVFVILDACNYQFAAGIEKLTFNQSLLNYEFGKKESFNLMNVFRVGYSIDDLKGEKQFLVSVDISICFEANKPCAKSIPILEEIRLPKPLCNLESGFSFPDISLKNFTQSVGLNILDQLPGYAVDLLLEKSGISQFLEEKPCDRMMSPYSPAVNGWNKTCPVDLSLPALTGPLTCHIPDYCTGVECCVDVKPIGRSFHVYIFLDACSNRIKLGIEKFGIDVSYLNFEFGAVQHAKLASIITVDYSIYDLFDEKKYMVNMNLSVCLEPGSCDINVEIFNEMYLPKIGCDWNVDFSGISVTDFLKEKGLSLSNQLSNNVISQVLERIGVTEYLESPQCDRHSSTYSPSKNGWKNDCPSNKLDLPALSGPLQCTLQSSCTAVDCCIYVDFLKRSFHVMLDIDMCSRKITLGVEKLKMDLSVLDYTWGVKDSYKLMDTVVMDYSIDNRDDKNIFKVSLNISVRFDPGNSMFDWVLLQDTPLPQIPCDWNSGFAIKDFSLTSWMQNVNLPSGQQLSRIMASKLFEQLGIGSLMEENSCQRSGAKYSPAVDGWKKDCPLNVPMTPLKIPATCLIPSHCTAVDCCVDVDLLGRSLHAYVDLDTCNNQFSVGIEKLKLDPVSLIDYKFGTTNHFNLKGAVRVTYKIDDLQVERQYRVSLNISVCFESSGSCLYDFELFNNALVPKILCDWELGFSVPGFSLQKFVTDAGLSVGQTLTDSVLSNLFNQLGISSYLLDTPCHLNEYTPSKDGWKTDCKNDLALPTLPPTARCSIGDSCTAVSCCMEVDVLKRAFNARVDLDTCNYKLRFGLEKLSQEIDLFDYKWGSLEKKYLMNVVRIEFIVEDMVDDKQFKVNLNLSLCFEDGKACMFTMNVFKDTKLPKVFCDWGTGFLIPDFSLTKFLESQGEKLGTILSSGATILLMKTLGVDKFLVKPECQRSSSPYILANGGWNSTACPVITGTPALPSTVSCSVASTCSAIDCCMDVKFIGQTINTKISLDPCKYELELKIEALQITKSLLNYKWGEKETFNLQGGIKLQYRIDDLASEKMFMLDLEFAICLEEGKPNDCVVNIPLLKNLKIPKPLCNWNMGYSVPNFSLNHWLTNNGITNTAKLQQYVVQQLLRELGVDEYLKVPQCNRKASPYIPSDNQGWNVSAECPAQLTLSSLPPNITCHITDTCTGINCCLDVGKLGLSLNTYVVLDTCDNKFTVGVEKFSQTISLLNVNFGRVETFSFLGLSKIEYKIEDFQSEKTFVVSVNVSVCLESNKPCDVQLEILKNVKLPKPFCHYSGEFSIATCPKAVNMPTLPVTMACSLPEYCTGIQCCTDIPLLGRSYKIEDLEAEKMFLFNAKISVCFESGGDCRYSYNVLENTKLPKQPCDWKSGFAVPGFSIAQWFADKGLPNTTSHLTDLMSSRLLEDLGIAGFMLHPSCDKLSAKYSPVDGQGWKSDCSSNITVPTLPNDIVCHLDSTCTGISCCVDVGLIDQSISVYLTLDPCDYKLNIGIEKYQFEFSLLDFEFGIRKRFHIAGVMEMDYKITDLPGEAAFYVDLDLKVCFDDPGLPGLLNTKVCLIHTNILSGTKLPKTPCGWQKGFVDSNWSLSTWYNNMGLKTGTQLPTDAVLLLMDTLGIAEFLKNKQCDRHDPFSVYASQYEGWSTDCRSTSVVLPRLQDDYITCYLDNTCRNVQCCMDELFISRSFQVQVNFDPCNYLMTFEIEKLQINATLNEYEWGKWKQIDLYGVIKLSFILHDLYAEDQYLLSLTLSLCWESHGSCQDHHIFRNARLPKPTCNWNMDFKIPGFSLATFLTSEGLTTLTDPVISQLSEDLGLSTYLNSPTCDRSALPYKPKVNGWNNECKTPVASLEDISSHAACHIQDRCTAIDCCITLPSFKRNVNVFVDLDPCEYRLSIAIEKVHLNLSLVDYKWGSFQQFSLLGVINLNFTIDDLASDDVFVFNMNVSICLESSGPCELYLHLFKSTKLPKQTCNWNTDYKIQDFSLRSYLTDLGLSSSLKKLESHTTSELLHDLGIAPFLLDDQCDRGNLPYFPNKDGWNKGCPKPVSLSPLPNNTFCHLYDYCTGVTCCSDVELIGRTIKTYVSLDPCNRKMSIGIEKLSVNTSLFDYHFGSIERVKLHGVVHLDYQVEDLESEKKFMVSLNLSICFESHGPCVVSIPVLKNARLPKAVCDWKSDFIDPNFSFERFLSEKRLAPNHHLNTNEMKSLMDKLRITEFLQDSQCDTSQSPFSPSVNGWNNDCKLPMTLLPNNTGPATCNIHNTCTAVECCVTAEQIGRSFRTFVNFEPCLFKLTVGIEQLTFDRLLFDYEWGQPVQVWLFGFVRLEFTISDLETEGQYLFDMTLKVCFEVEGPCYVTVNVFNKYRLPKPACDWNTDFSIKGFSFDQWMKNESFTATPTLAPYMTSKLLSDLNVAAYMKNEKCKLNGPLFTPNIKGWKSECPTPIAVPDLPDNIVCHISGTCTDVNCCVHIPLINKTFDAYIKLDPCYEKLSVGIEKMHNQYKLLDYTYGKTENFNLLGLLRFEYSMFDFKDEGMYVMNLTLSFCVESSSNCNISIPVLQNVRLPKKTCTWTEDYKVKDFSLDQWTKERNQKPGAVLPDYHTSELLQQLDITNYLNTSMCSRKNSTNGWIKDCPENVTLPDLTANPLTCQLHSSCTSVECCMDVPFIGKTFRAILDLNQDTQILNVGIEKLQFPISLLDFEFGKDHEFRLNSIVRIRYNIYDLESQNKYLVTMEISMCWEKYKSCDWTAKVFDHTRLPKLTRNKQTGFNIPTCAEEIHLASLPPNSACHVTDTCTDIQCCVDIPILQRSVSLQINLEPCDLRLTVQLEGMEYSQMLYNYSWGTQDSFWLRGVFRFSYKIEDLVLANRYRLSLQFDSCFESSQPCSQSVTILDKVELPKVVCDWKQDYQIQDFSVDQWKQIKSFKASTMAEYEVSQLLEETRLGFYLNDSQCIIPTGSSKWKNECPSPISPAVLDGPIHCHISKECTSVDCCVNDEITQRNYNIYLTIDPCDFKLIIGAEKYTFTQSLLDFKWKSQYLFEMEGIIRMSIDVEDLPGQGVYIVSVNSSICWDNNSTCDYSVKIFENIQLPKPTCNYNKDYLTNDFSLTQWYTDTGYKATTTLTGNPLTDILEELGIVRYYETSECNRTLLPYQPTEANGWNIACPALEDTLPTLPSEVSCSLPNTCTGVDCCVDVELLGQSVYTTVDIDPCYLGMTVGIERMRFNTSLMDYTWGSVIDVALYGVVRFKLTVDDLSEENLYIVNMNISVCFESKGPCAIESAVILQNSLIPKMQCNFTHGFNIQGFSLSRWLTERDLKGTKTIPKFIVSQMMEYLDLSSYLHDTSCNRQVAPWGPNFDGWMKECKTPISVPYLKETETTCIVEDTCTAVRCCVEMSLLDRSFVYSIKLDACSFVLSVGIEKLTHNRSLIGYKYGKKILFKTLYNSE